MVPITLLKLVENNSILSVLSSLYHSNGFELYLVGGAVRDGILDIPTEVFARVVMRRTACHDIEERGCPGVGVTDGKVGSHR